MFAQSLHTITFVISQTHSHSNTDKTFTGSDKIVEFHYQISSYTKVQKRKCGFELKRGIPEALNGRNV